MAIRGREVLWADALASLRAGDQVFLFSRSTDLQALDRILIGERESGRLGERTFFGDFVISPGAPLETLAYVYGFDIEAAIAPRTIGSLLTERYPTPVVGDRLTLGGIVFTVREIRDGRIHEVGLKLPAAPA